MTAGPASNGTGRTAATVGLLTAIAACLYGGTLWVTADLPVWFDEAHTYLVVRDGIGGVFRNLAVDVHPPLFFLIVAGVCELFGYDEWVLRATSAVAATVVVPVVFLVGRTLGSDRTGFIAAAFAAASPLLHHYAYEARSYALLVLLTGLVLLTYVRLLKAGAGAGSWAAFVVTLVALLQTHNYGLFLLPWLVVYPLTLARPDRLRLAAGAAVAAFAAFLTYLPWFLAAVENRHSVHWLRGDWFGAGRVYKPLTSLVTFGFSPEFPRHLRQLKGIEPPHDLSTMLLALLLVAPILFRVQADDPAVERLAPRRLLWAAALGPLLLAWGYSWGVRPIYLVGRYDLIGLLPALVLFAIGADVLLRRGPRGLGAGCVGLALALGTFCVQAALKNATADAKAPEFHRDAVRHLGDEAEPGDWLVATGMSLPQLRYHLDRRRLDLRLVTFPAEYEYHPGWYASAVFLEDEDRLVAEAEATTDRLVRAAADGTDVWLFTHNAYGEQAVTPILLETLRTRFAVDAGRSDASCRVFRLVPTESGSPNVGGWDEVFQTLPES